MLPVNTFIDYAIPDGRIRQAVINGKTFYDESKGIALPDWEGCVSVLVVAYHMNSAITYPEGLKAFVYRLIKERKIPMEYEEDGFAVEAYCNGFIQATQTFTFDEPISKTRLE